MRSAQCLYRLHTAIAVAGASVVLAAGATVLANPELPSSASVSEACDTWVSGGGPAALFGLALVALLLTVTGLGVASVWRQVRANRRYLDSLPIGGENEHDGVPYRLVESAEPMAFCAGYLRPEIYVSRGARARLADRELSVVLAHERHHVLRRDPLRRLAARALADSLFFVPILRRISDRYRALGEVAADEAALSSTADRRSLAAALLKFSERDPVPAAVAGIDPERVDRLVGDPRSASWRLPGSVLGRSILALAGLAALVLLSWHGILNLTLEVPFILAAACALLMIGGPIALAAVAVRISVRGLRARRA